MVRANKGEWSELYALLYLLATGKLYAADEDINRIESLYFPILKVLRNEVEGRLEFNIASDREVELYINDRRIKTIKTSDLAEMAKKLLAGIRQGGDRAFEIPPAEEIMREIHCHNVKAPSTDKTDITLQVLDVNTGFSPQCGFSIKSKLGGASTLLNAGLSTNFKYEIIGITDSDMEEINGINTRNKILDRIQRIRSLGRIKYCRACDSRFSRNLVLIDSLMDDIIGEALLYSYSTGEVDCEAIVDKLTENNPLGCDNPIFYKFKFKKLLCSIALGMIPSKPWDGQDQANGGYIIVTESGEVLAYHIYNRDYFEQYLLRNTKFERGSTTRHKYASIYKENNKYYINLNLQIRFK